MKVRSFWLVLCLPLLLTLTFVRTAGAHDETFRVAIEKDDSPIEAGSLRLEFELIDLKERKLLSDSDLIITHEKKLHAFIFDPSLMEFRHEHPEFINSRWVLQTDLAKNGNYWLWLQGSLAVDQEEFTCNSRIIIQKGAPQNPMPPILGELRKGTDGNSQITLSNQKIRAKKMVMLTLKFTRTDGTTPVLTPYLGELAHAVAVAEDGYSFVHVHPMNTGNANELMLHALFQEEGQYRVWVQFIDDQKPKLIALSVIVHK